MINDIGEQLEYTGWRQGSIVKSIDVPMLLADKELDCEGVILIVASQSCDIAHNNLDVDPFIEISIARVISTPNGNLTYNKNPRVLHTYLDSHYNPEASMYVELKAHERIQIDKTQFVGLDPDEDLFIEPVKLAHFVDWLACRFKRPALPTAFNQQLDKIDPKDKRKKKAKQLNDLLSGIYIKITPDCEIAEGQTYEVRLLGIIIDQQDNVDNRTRARELLEAFVDVMQRAGMDVAMAVVSEDEVSIAVIKQYKRFYYDDLSMRNGCPLPYNA